MLVDIMSYKKREMEYFSHLVCGNLLKHTFIYE